MNQSPSIKPAVDAAVADALAQQLTGKKFWLSKTFWVNVLVALGLLVQVRTGFIIGAEYQALALTVINLLLRKITKEPVIW